MRIIFDIDVSNKKITFFVRYGELRKWVEQGIKDNPDLSSEEIANNGSHNLALVTSKVVQNVCEANGVENWGNLKPRFVQYKSSSELPMHLRQ